MRNPLGLKDDDVNDIEKYIVSKEIQDFKKWNLAEFFCREWILEIYFEEFLQINPSFCQLRQGTKKPYGMSMEGAWF